MTQYIHRVTAACPESMAQDANQLAACFGENLNDIYTYSDTKYQDSQGNIYRVMSTVATENLLIKHGSGQVTRPDFDVDSVLDLVAAQRALDAVVISSVDVDGNVVVPKASPTTLVAVVDLPPMEAIEKMGLIQISI